MNTNDIEKIDNTPAPEGDKLDMIFEGQSELMEKYLPIAEAHFEKVFGSKVKIDPKSWYGQESNLHTKLGNFLIKDMIDAAIQELAESVQTLKNWKARKQTEMQSDVEHWKEEMVDALHFYVEALLLAGVTSEELYNLYFKKNKVNQFRQKSQY